MTIQVPNAAEQQLLARLLSQSGASSMNLRLYVNNVSLTGINTGADTITVASFTEMSTLGYTSPGQAMANGSWTITLNGAYQANGAYAPITWTFTAGTAVVVYGYYVTDASSGQLLWFEPFSSPKTVQYAGDQIVITPNFLGY